MHKKITKAVFPVAGLGSRFLPATKASPKEMLPIVDKPLIQYAVEEAAAAGITDMIFITGRNKRAIEDHFDKAYELESELAAQGKTRPARRSCRRSCPRAANCIYIRQAEPLGLGHAVLCAQPVVGDEPFAVILADDLIDSQPPALAQMTSCSSAKAARCSAWRRCRASRRGSYGIVSRRPEGGSDSRDPRHRREAEARGRAVHARGGGPLRPDAARSSTCSPRAKPGAAARSSSPTRSPRCSRASGCWRCASSGKRYDCGSKLGYLQATVELGLRHREVGKEFSRIPRSSRGR